MVGFGIAFEVWVESPPQADDASTGYRVGDANPSKRLVGCSLDGA
jgi:hypothetical protein